MRLLTLLLAFIHVSAATPAVADLFEDASIAYSEGDYATAIRLLLPLAEKGDAEAQNNVGLMYALGHGVPQDATMAVSWFRKAVDQGNRRRAAQPGRHLPQRPRRAPGRRHSNILVPESR